MMQNQKENYEVQNQDDSNKTNEQEEYWIKKFSGELARSNFRYDYKETVSNVRIIDSVDFRFAGEIFKRLASFCGESAERLYHVLQTGLVVLLGKHTYTQSGIKDIIVGTPVLFMQRKVVDTKPGNTILALRNKFADNVTFKELLDQVQKDTIEANEHKDYPVEELPERLDMQIYGDDFPLFDVAISLENIQDRRYIRHLNVNMIFSFFKTARYIDGVVEYNSALFERDTVKKIIRQFNNMLLSGLANIDMPLYSIDILTEEEKKQLLFMFNDTKVDYPGDKTIHELFEAQVEKTPGNTAVVYRNHHLSYRGLDEKANQLANVLRHKGVNPDEMLGVMVSRSLEMMVALLAVLKAGGAYVPIDPGYPLERIKFYLQDSDTSILLTQEDIAREFAASGFKIETLDLFDESIYSENKTRPVNIASPHNLAYVIFTSGSTGKPKGVMIRHRNAVNFFKGMTDKISFSPGKVILALTTVSFDIFLLETLLPVTFGLKVVVADETQQKDPRLLKNLLTRTQVNLLQATPSRLKLLLSSAGTFACLKRIEEILVGGEPFPDSLFEYLKKVFPGKIIDVYGPTETTVWSTLKDLTGLEEINIGTPIVNTQIYIVDQFKSLQPLGTIGELYIGGDGVARGYLNRPDLTSERFVENPFPEADDPARPYKEIYQTGDLARWLPNGEIDFLGRIDHQVKIRGFRIETGEIESHVLKQPGIREAVVMARDDDSGEKYLCAYIVSDKKVDIPTLDKALSKSLLDYMIPSHFVQIEKIPLTPNGKVDRKKLPDPRKTRKAEDYTAPRNEIEEKLVEIWARLLHMKKDVISMDDNFFRLGGHSLKAAVLITEIHKVFDVKVSMHEIFSMPTIEKTARYIKGATKEAYASIELAEEKEYYAQTSAQKRLFFIHQFEKESILYNIQLMDVYCKGIEKEELQEAFRQLIKRHESLRTSFFSVEGEAVQRVHSFEEVGIDFEIEYYETTEEALIYHPQKGGSEESRGVPFMEVVDSFVRPFDLNKAPLIRVGLIKIWGKTQILMIDMHHIMSDGVSEVILINDLWALYEGEELPPLEVQYKDFARWISSEEQQEEIKKQENFWLKEFKGEIPILNLPYDFLRPAKMTFDGDAKYFDINKEEAQKLNIIAQEQGATLYMVLIAVYNVLLAKLSGQEEIIIGTVSAGRNHADLQDIIGMFVDTLALRNFPKSNKTFKEFLREVKERILTAFEHQGYPFEELVSSVAQRQDTSRNPLFDVVFALENEAERSEEYLLDVLMMDESNPYRFKVKKSKFDMVLIGIEKRDGLEFSLEYNIQLFKGETIERFIMYFKKIVSSICGSIQQEISGIDIMPDLERGILLYSFNDTDFEYPKNKTINELFEQQVSQTPDNIAVSGMSLGAGREAQGAERLTYRELNAQANQLGRVLRARGMRPDNLAAIMIEPCQEMIIGLMGILKAGGAYLPIKDGTPKERCEYILQESGTRFLLTRKQLLEGIIFAGEMIELDNPGMYGGDRGNLPHVNTPHDLAYVIYTSGSTGKPKGVTIIHRTLINLCFWHNDYYSVTPNDHATKYAGFGFDASVWEVFPYLVIGAALYIVPEEIKLDINTLNQYFHDNGITISFLPTQLCEQFMTIENTSLRVLLTGGDKLKTFVKKNYQLYNNYGPTENTVVATSCPVNELTTNIPIGKPLYNNQIYIMDKDDNLQPIGVPGELCIGGDSLARGYLNNPKLTREKFIDSPFKHLTPWAKYPRIYRTGDLARWLSNGNIEFLGRIDYQVKVRGFRIELGEIENQLLHQEEVKEAVVVARDDPAGQKYLCAYFVSAKPLDTAAIKGELAKKLPDYMVPSFLIQIESIPLTPNGKIDTRALPEPEIKGVEYTAPSNETEEILAKIWSEVLGMEKVGIDDNFFENGGDSIKTILVSARLEKHQIYTNVNDFFSYPTIRELAKNLEKIEQVPARKVTITRDEQLIAQLVQQDYTKYLEHIKKEEWPDLTGVNDYQYILLTGATGYMGSYLAHGLLTSTNAALYLPVRGKNQQEAEERLKRKMEFYFGKDFFEQYMNRMTVIRADLKEDKLGMDSSWYEQLCETPEAVLHAAANVKHYGLYEEFHRDNVEATVQLLEFALTGKKKDFYFISTLDTGRGHIPGKDHLLYTEYCQDEGQEIDNVYIKSKFAAEKQVMNYRERGLDASIYRAANMTFHSETGLFQENIRENFFYSMLNAFIKVGFWSDKMMNIEFDLSFINYAARAIVSLMSVKHLENQIYHICNPHTLNWTDMAGLLKESGIEVNNLRMKPEEVKANLSQYQKNAEYEKIIQRVNIYSWEWEDTGETLTVPRVDRTVTLLKKLGFEWPKPTLKHIEKMIAHCREVGFI